MGAEPPGFAVPGFRILEEVGRGGMGVVYRAEQTALGRQVALKVLAEALADDPRFRERFTTEWRIVARLHHPHIVPVYTAGQVGRRLYLAMRFIPGQDLGQLIAHEGTLDLGRTIELLAQAGSALDAAHEQGLVHRDVKPPNLLVEPLAEREHCWLSDFGISKDLAAVDGPTLTGQPPGTPGYEAPEQVRGELIDGRCDVYAMGCVLFKCLTGVAVFRRTSDDAVRMAHVLDPPPSVLELRPDLPGALDQVIATALAKDPDDRYPTCAALIDVLRACASAGASTGTGLPTRARTSPPARPTRPARRAWLAWLVAAGVVALGLVVTAAATVIARREPAPLTQAPTAAPAGPTEAVVAVEGCKARVEPYQDYQGRGFDTRYYCSTYIGAELYGNVRDSQDGEPLDDTGYVDPAVGVWVICQLQGRANPPLGGNTNDWWLYTQGDGRSRPNAHGYAHAWGYLPATAVIQGAPNQQIPGVPVCPEYY